MKIITAVKCTVFAALFFLLAGGSAVTARAQMGDSGLFGGISEGRRLPLTTEQLVQSAGQGRSARLTLNYSEVVFLAGQPATFTGLIELSSSGGVPDNPAAGSSGSYTVNYRVYPSPGAESAVVVNRTANFNVRYRVEGSQVIYTYEIVRGTWREVVTTPGGTFTLNNRLSSYSASIIEDRAPGVSYYRGDISGRMVYDNDTTAEQTGSFYGYNSAWSSTETHRMDVTVINGDWGMAYQVRPSVTVNKILQYAQNEPTAISFEGNYKEVTQTISGLRYDIFIKPNFLFNEPNSGSTSLSTVNTFEQLPAADLSFLKGNAAEDDISRLFAMQILGGDPRFYQPSQAMTRGQFMTALAKAIKLPVEETTSRAGARGRQPVVSVLYADVDSTRPEYPYIMAIYKYGVAMGRQGGSFDFDQPIQRQEAYVTLVRALGLTRLAPNPTPVTHFTDDAQVAGWAKREVTVAAALGLIYPDDAGRIYPTRLMNKGEAAHLLNILIEYMRIGLVSDYAEQIVNIPR